jgi:hypothetical protein
MRKALILILILAAIVVLPAVAASADPGKHGTTPASCTGIESAGISPKGSSDEFPGGRPELNSILKAAFPDTPFGRIVSEFAKVHAGSHEGCDAGE